MKIHNILALFFALMFATAIMMPAGCSKKEEPVKPAEEVAKAPEPEKMDEEAKSEEEAKPSEAPVPEKK